jgi:hypothetical protein
MLSVAIHQQFGLLRVVESTSYRSQKSSLRKKVTDMAVEELENFHILNNAGGMKDHEDVLRIFSSNKS